MARGMAAGEPIVSQARTREFEEGYERVFGDRKPVRGRWVWDSGAQKLVPAEDYQGPTLAVDAPILTGRFYENTQATDGTDIGSRRKHRNYMKANNLTIATDYTETWKKQAADRERMKQGDFDHKARREEVAWAFHQRHKP